MKETPRILVVDDDAATLRATGRILKSAGFHVIEASTGADGLRAAQEHLPDLVLLDVGLADLSGVQVCHQIKADLQLANIFVVLLSSIETDADSPVQGLEAGADGYIARPIADGELVARVQAMLRIQAAEDALREYAERLEQMIEERTRELRQAQEQLIQQERLTVLGQLAGGISHELRSPLGAIKNAVYLLNLAHPSPDPETAEILQILKQQIANAERSITSLMDFVRPEPPYRRDTNLCETIDAALGQITIPANVTLIRQFDAALPALSVDPDQLQIVFGNLIRNAIQAMPEGGQLTIDARQTSGVSGNFGSLEISFSDTGIGIAPDVLDKIFQPLFSTKARGMGLGLSLCKMLVEGHNGKIQVTSQVGKGTTFTICLPMA